MDHQQIIRVHQLDLKSNQIKFKDTIRQAEWIHRVDHPHLMAILKWVDILLLDSRIRRT